MKAPYQTILSVYAFFIWLRLEQFIICCFVYYQKQFWNCEVVILFVLFILFYCCCFLGITRPYSAFTCLTINKYIDDLNEKEMYNCLGAIILYGISEITENICCCLDFYFTWATWNEKVPSSIRKIKGSHNPAHAQGLIQAFALHWCIL